MAVRVLKCRLRGNSTIEGVTAEQARPNNKGPAKILT